MSVCASVCHSESDLDIVWVLDGAGTESWEPRKQLAAVAHNNSILPSITTTRVGVIVYWSNVSIELTLSKSESMSIEEMRSLIVNLDPQPKGTRRDIALGLRTALDMFGSESEPLRGGSRHKVVVLIAGGDHSSDTVDPCSFRVSFDAAGVTVFAVNLKRKRHQKQAALGCLTPDPVRYRDLYDLIDGWWILGASYISSELCSGAAYINCMYWYIACTVYPSFLSFFLSVFVLCCVSW